MHVAAFSFLVLFLWFLFSLAGLLTGEVVFLPGGLHQLGLATHFPVVSVEKDQGRSGRRPWRTFAGP